jgi:Spy/CpxP family protein refolding chaperone
MLKLNKFFFIFMFFSLISFNAVAQDDETDIKDIPGITKEQKTQIKDIKKESEEKIKLLKNDKQELIEELNALMIIENPDINSINTKVEEINNKKSEIFKTKVRMHLDIKALLTAEQKKWYDENIISDFISKKD